MIALLTALLCFPSAHAEDVAAPALALAPAEDPYLWLEDVQGDRALDWVRAQNAVAQAELAQGPEFQALNDRLLAVLDSDAKIPYVSKMGRYYYNFWKDATHQRGVWRRTRPSSYDNTQPKWDVVLDVDALGATEGESWVWGGASCLAPVVATLL